jgi:hypothetical protein
MAQIPELRGQFTVGTSQDSFGMNSQTAALTAGTYYLECADDESNGLIDDLQTQMRKFTDQASANVSYSKTTGFVTLAMTGGANIEFDDSELADILGFASTTQAAAATHTGTQVPKHIWRPTRGLSGHPVDANTFWAPRSSTIVGRSVDGTTYSREGTKTYDADIEFKLLPVADVCTPGSGTIYRDLQQFFEDVASKGSLIRVYHDRGTSTDSDSWSEGLWGSEDDEELGAFLDYADRHFKRWQALWGASIPLMKKV